MLYHVVSKNSISASVGMQQNYVINGIQHVGVSRSFSITFFHHALLSIYILIIYKLCTYNYKETYLSILKFEHSRRNVN